MKMIKDSTIICVQDIKYIHEDPNDYYGKV